MRLAAFRVGGQLGVHVDAVLDEMPYRDLVDYMAYQRITENELTKQDYYLARITAMQAAKLNPKARSTVSEFLIGDDGSGVLPGHTDLRKPTSDEVKAIWRAAFPFAEYKETPNNG